MRVRNRGLAPRQRLASNRALDKGEIQQLTKRGTTARDDMDTERVTGLGYEPYVVVVVVVIGARITEALSCAHAAYRSIYWFTIALRHELYCSSLLRVLVEPNRAARETELHVTCPLLLHGGHDFSVLVHLPSIYIYLTLSIYLSLSLSLSRVLPRSLSIRDLLDSFDGRGCVYARIYRDALHPC